MPSWKKLIVENSAPLVSSSAVVTGETLTNGYVTDITPSTQVNDIIDQLNIALGRLAPSRPAGLTGRGLRVTNTTYQAGIAHSSDWAGGLAGTQPALQVVASNTVSFTSSQASTAVQGANVQFSASTALGSNPAGAAIVTFGAGPAGGTSGVLTVGNVTDPYSSTAPGFWYTFSASIASATAPQTVGTFSSASYILRESAGGTVASQSIFVDSATTPSVSLTTNASTIPAPSTYISGIPTLVTGSTACNYTASITNAVGKFYRTNILQVSESAVGTVFTTQTKSPASTPASASSVEIKDVLTVATGKFADPIVGTAAQITATAYNVANTTGTGTATFGDVYIDSVSVEGARVYSSASTTYPSTNQGYASNTFDSSVALTNSRNKYATNTIVEMQLRNGVYISPQTNYSTLYNSNFGSTIDYTTLSSIPSASFSQYYSLSNITQQQLTMTINGSGFGSVNATTKVQPNVDILVKFRYNNGNSYTVWGNANKAVTTGESAVDGVGIMVADSGTTGTNTQIKKKLNLVSLNGGGFNASTAVIDRVYVRLVNYQAPIASVNQVITFA